MYQDVFTIDKVLFKDRKVRKESVPKYVLKNFNYYHPKLEEEFYLKHFIRSLLFDIDILEVEAFLEFQFGNSQYQDEFLRIITFKIMPKIDTIIDHAQPSFTGNSYYNEVPLEDDFVETESVIKNPNYEDSMFYHLTALGRLHNDLAQRKIIISEYVATIHQSQNNNNPDLLKWVGKPSHLAFLIRQLVDQGYIEAPIGNDKEINLSALTRNVMASFTHEKEIKFNTIKPFLDSESDQYFKLNESFKKQRFSLPDSGLLG